ncbi:hypothetical protein IAQ61_006177, partial [Plenodomus lingam]
LIPSQAILEITAPASSQERQTFSSNDRFICSAACRRRVLLVTLPSPWHDYRGTCDILADLHCHSKIYTKNFAWSQQMEHRQGAGAYKTQYPSNRIEIGEHE